MHALDCFSGGLRSLEANLVGSVSSEQFYMHSCMYIKYFVVFSYITFSMSSFILFRMALSLYSVVINLVARSSLSKFSSFRFVLSRFFPVSMIIYFLIF